MKIVWTESAGKSLETILDFIAESNPQNAVKFIETIEAKVEILYQFPLAGRTVPEFNDQALREIIYQNYRIIYRVEKKQIVILTIWHSKRKLR